VSNIVVISRKCETFNLRFGELPSNKALLTRRINKTLTSDVSPAASSDPLLALPRLRGVVEQEIVSHLARSLMDLAAFTEWAPRVASKTQSKWPAEEFTARFCRLVNGLYKELDDAAGTPFEKQVAASVQARRHLLLAKFRKAAGSTPEESTPEESTPEESAPEESLDDVNKALYFLRVNSANVNRFAVDVRDSLYFDNSGARKLSAIETIVGDAFSILGTFNRDVGIDDDVSATFMLDWELPQFMRSEMEGSTEVGSVVTISGSAVFGRVVQCSAYIKELWPRLGPVILDCIERALDPTLGAYSEFCTDLTPCSHKPLGCFISNTKWQRICQILARREFQSPSPPTARSTRILRMHLCKTPPLP